MPPIRTISSSKPVKTERTHEENQERAYIAASRRSDRSLEARVESARRASEIHKRRTGRSLRVTEQDVVNEEMYEEEDDDLPMQYRRLTAHLQTGSADFNRRLAAYLTNHVAMRTALDQAISSSYAQSQQYPSPPQFAHPSQLQQPSPAYPTPMMPPHMMHLSPQSYRQTPYPMPATHSFRPHYHHPSASVSEPQELAQYPQIYTTQGPADMSFDNRPSSLPVQANSPSSLATAQSRPHSAIPSQNPSPLSRSPSMYTAKQVQNPTFYQGHDPAPAQRTSKQSSAEPPVPQWQTAMPLSHPMNPYASFGPFSTALPMESQQFLGPALDPNDPFTSVLMSGSQAAPQQPFYSYNPNAGSTKSRKFQPSLDGMNQTLAPAFLDTSNSESDYTSPKSVTTDGIVTPFTPAFSYGFDTGLDTFKPSNITRSNSIQGSGGVTPAVEGEWTNFIDINSWDDNTVAA